MTNLIGSITRILTNKNTVTILGVIAGVILLWAVYNWQLKRAINLVEVPYAVKRISAETKITKDHYAFVKVSSDTIKKAGNKLYTRQNIGSLIGKYVKTGTSIPEGGMFFTDQCVEQNGLSNDIITKIPEGYRPITIKVNSTTTYGNSITPKTKIDLYVKYKNDGKVYNYLLIKNIEVFEVLDSQERNVFDDYPNRTPVKISFAVNNEYHGIINSANQLSGVELYPVPRGVDDTNPGELGTGFETARQYIEARSRTIY